jgi:uncharacterized protein YbjT (DUF2867 family)
MQTIAVIGGTGRVGRLVVERLAQQPDRRIVVLGRSAPVAPPAGNVAFARVHSPDDITIVVGEATHVVNCASLALNDAIHAGRSARLERAVLLGSTHIHTAFADDLARMLRAQEEGFRRSGLPGVILHASMIYGGGDRNISRVARLLMRSPVIPLPHGGRSLIQPIHYADVAMAIEAALFAPEACGEPMVIAGPQPMTIRAMVEAVAAGIGRRARIVPVPVSLIHAAAALTRMLPGLPDILPAQVQRMFEDRAFDISDMRRRLNVEPRPFAVDRSILADWQP